MTFQEAEYIATFSAIIAVVMAVWHHARTVLGWLAHQFVVEQRANWHLGSAVVEYLNDSSYRPKRGTEYYSSSRLFVRPLQRYAMVAFQHIDVGLRWFWNKSKRRLIWYYRSHDDDQPSSGDGNEFHFRFFYIRGTVKWLKLIEEVMNSLNAKSEDEEQSRFRIIKYFGSDGDDDGDGLERLAEAAKNGDTFVDVRAKRPLGWSLEDLGPSLEVSSLDRLSLSNELVDLVEEAKFWKSSELWYRARGVPWRRGFGFEGPAGTGKTSMARGLAEELNMPVIVMDLGTMSNQDLYQCWTNAVRQAPCMILLEDIDSVFNGRENISKAGTLSFDCLLNCIDGADKSDGILLVMTTNHIENLDPALKRPGRMDRVVTFRPLDQVGRKKLALRILEDERMATEMANKYSDLSAAEFQEKCFQVAIDGFFKSRAA